MTNPHLTSRGALFAQAARGPVLLIVVGILFALQQADLVSVSRSWPLLIIAIGLMKLAERLLAPSVPPGVSAGVPPGNPPGYRPPPQPPPQPSGRYGKTGYTGSGYGSAAHRPPSPPPAPGPPRGPRP